MREETLKDLLRRVADGEVTPDEALKAVRGLPFEDIGFAKIDHHRTLRCGVPEVVFCQGKSPEQVAGIAERIVAAGTNLLATRADARHFEAVRAVCPEAEYKPGARAITLRQTSVGYGASFGGIAALLTMLNSCASGVAVVNIDNGFGAGYMAALINAMATDGGANE